MKSIKGIDLRHLRYFVAVAEQGSFSKAAAQLHMAQPPLSQQIMDLEARIGANLFVRDKRHVMLSEAGRALLPDAQAIIAQTQAAVQRAQRVSRG
jgi:DNA-binding transcriptional LysR family regulator